MVKKAKDLSIIMPSVNEWPQNVFSMQSIVDSIMDPDLDYEIILVDNCSQPAGDQRDNNAVRAELDKLIRACVRPDGVSLKDLGNAIKPYFYGFITQGERATTRNGASATVPQAVGCDIFAKMISYRIGRPRTMPHATRTQGFTSLSTHIVR